MTIPSGDLPVLVCGGCTLCCQKQEIPLTPGIDKMADYEVVRSGSGWAIPQKTNGDCVYLDREFGCVIWRKRPAVCRAFDCRMAIGARPDIQARGEELLRRKGERDA